MSFDRHAPHPSQLSLPLFDDFASSSFSDTAAPPSVFTRPPAAVPAHTLDAPPPLREGDSLRSAVLLGEVVRYVFRRAQRKTIGFAVDEGGLRVSAPRWVRLADIDEALHEKARWILKKLQQQRERREQLTARRVDWCDGAELPFLGAPIRLRLDASAADTLFDAEARTLRLPLAPDADTQQIKDRVQAWLQRQAGRVFEERVALYAERLRVRVREIKLSSASTRWGTASADGLIRLNWRLIHFALPVVDYVCAHEVAHLREMHHGPAFWATVKSIFPEFEEARAQLKDEALPRFEE